MTDLRRAQFEESLARAHRALWTAKNRAEALGEFGACMDLQQMEVELVRIAEGSLKGKMHRPLRGQLTFDGPPKQVS